MIIASWTIINNEIDFIADIIDCHLPWLDQMYFLDTGSTDGTLEFLRQASQNNPKIILQEYPTKFVPQYDKRWEEMPEPFPEVEVRNFALEQVEKLGADWLIQLDGDEVFLAKTKDIILANKNYDIAGHSTINPVEKIRNHPIERRHGKVLYDPHARIWKNGLGIRYQQNPAFQNKQYHCIPVLNKKHIYHSSKINFIEEPIHFHLHWMYGKKAEKFFSSLSPIEIAKQQQSPNFWRSDIWGQELLPLVFFERRRDWLFQDFRRQLTQILDTFIGKKSTPELIQETEDKILNLLTRLSGNPKLIRAHLFLQSPNCGDFDLVFFHQNQKIQSDQEIIDLLIYGKLN